MKSKFDITGMTCSACSSHVEKAVQSQHGIDNVTVNLLNNSMTVEYDSSVATNQSIIEAVESVGYGAVVAGDPTSAKSTIKDSSIMGKLIASVVLTVVLMYVAMGNMAGLPLPSFLQGTANAVSFALTQLLITIAVVMLNQRYFVSGYGKLIKGSANMDSLIAIGCTASIAYGIFAIFMMSYGLGVGNNDIVNRYHHDLYFESAAMILTLVSVGKAIEHKSKGKTQSALDKLKQLVPPTAIVLRDGEETIIDSRQLAVGDIVALKAGMSIPADCVVVSGSAYIDESAITGESIPVERTVDDKVIGGTVIVGGYLVASVVGVGDNSKLSQIIDLVEQASNTKPPIAKLADKVAGVFVPIVMAVALCTLVVWLIIGKDVEFALARSIAVLVISCPCALGLATPLAIMVATGKGANNGILVKSGEALQQLSKIKVVVLDKTGTITTGKPTLTDLIALGNWQDNDLLTVVNSIEQRSEHPLGHAIVAYARQHDIPTIDVQEYSTVVGQGVIAVVQSSTYAVGNSKLMDSQGVDAKEYSSQATQLSLQGKTALIVACDAKCIGIIAVADAVKPTSKLAVQRLTQQGTQVVMLTGDNELTAQAVATQVGIAKIHANVDPIGKAEIVSYYKTQGTTMFVGDGINDAPTLAIADVGAAVAGGSDIAIDSADVILLKDDLLDVVGSINLGKMTIANIKQNLFWAFAYNTLGIPLAMGVLYYTSWQLVLSPMLGAVAMSLSSLFVVGNALRLYAKRLGNRNSDLCQLANSNNEALVSAELPSSSVTNKHTYRITISAMMCNNCVAHVSTVLQSLYSVQSVDVSLADKAAVVVSEQSLPDELILQSIADAGYKVDSIEEI